MKDMTRAASDTESSNTSSSDSDALHVVHQ
jgi:hypothetical protein